MLEGPKGIGVALLGPKSAPLPETQWFYVLF